VNARLALSTWALVILGVCGARARSQGARADLLAGFLSGDARARKEAIGELRASRASRIKGLIRIVEDPLLRVPRREVVVSAIQLLGELRAREAVRPLVGLLLYGRRADIHDLPRREIGKQPEPPDAAAPAVLALIQIGAPSLGPVTERLVTIAEDAKDKNHLWLHCLWVIKGVLGPRLGKAYLEQLRATDERARASAFVSRGLRFMHTYRKLRGAYE